MMMLVAVLGTTISPYLFFWQAAQEVEEIRMHRIASRSCYPEHGARASAPDQDRHLGRHDPSQRRRLLHHAHHRGTLHAAGITNIETSAQAAQALRPLAGEFAFTLFALGIIGTGLLALPVLAGSAAYAVAEAMQWPTGLDLTLPEAKGFYGIIAFATAVGVALDFTPIDPIKALVWAAVINGVVAVPIMAVMMRMAVRRNHGHVHHSRRLRGWAGSRPALMAVTVVAMIVSLFV